jgi:hypothetical protein
MPIPPPCWPDLRVDQESWSEAKQRLGPDAGLSELARAAQSVKAAHAVGQGRAHEWRTGARSVNFPIIESGLNRRMGRARRCY